jgi:hypothetical protein
MYKIVHGIKTGPKGIMLDYGTCKEFHSELIPAKYQDSICQIGCRVEWHTRKDIYCPDRPTWFSYKFHYLHFKKLEDADKFMEWFIQ